MANAPVAIELAAPDYPWADAWKNPQYYRGITSKRVFAYMVDLIVVSLLVAVVWFGFGILGIATFGLLLPLQALAVALTPLAYHTLMIASPRSATLGMRVFGVQVRSISPQADAGSGRPTFFQAMIQTVSFYGSVALTSFLILAVALFNPRRRMLHDWLAGTVTVNDLGQWHHPTA